MTLRILDKTHLESVKRAQRSLHDIIPLMDDAEACGVDCISHRKIADDFAKILIEIEKRFLTPAPPS
jgi:hypothetical protein